MAALPDSVPVENGSVTAAEPEAPPPPTAVTSDDAGDASVAPPSSSAPETVSVPAQTPVTEAPTEKKWPGWPGDSVFRLIVPVLKVGSIIGRKGELIKKMCEETKARIRILEGASGTTDRVVLISGKEDPEVSISPAMEAVLRVFKRVSGISETEGEATGVAKSSIRLLVASSQAIYLIGKQGSVIKSVQESSGASVRVLPENEVPFYASPDERIIDIQGESSKVLKALEAVIGHLRKFLVDHSVLPLFEKAYNATITQDRPADQWADKTYDAPQTGSRNDFSLSMKRDPYLERETPLEPQLPHTGLSLYGQDPAISGLRSSGLGRAIVTQVTQTMQIPLSYAEDIIGVGGANIAYIRRTSGAILTIQESAGLPDEITVEIKGTSTQVQTAQQLIQDFISRHNTDSISSSYGTLDSGLRSYSQLPNTSYPSSSLSSQTLGGYGPAGGGGYSSYRI